MSLTQDDLQQIRTVVASVVEEVVRPTVQSAVEPLIEPLQNEIQALRNDIHEIYDMLADLQSATITDKEFKKRNLEDKLLTINAELLAAAEQAGITLPRE